MTPEEWGFIENFTPEEFKCNCGQCDKDGSQMDWNLMLSLDIIRHLVKRPVIITSGMRCIWYQEHINPGVLGAHPLGRAADIIFKNNEQFLELCAAIKAVNSTINKNMVTHPLLGLGVYLTERFIHIDNMQSGEEVAYENGVKRTFKRPAMWGS